MAKAPKNSVTKKDISKKVSDRCRLNFYQTKLIINTFFDIMLEELYSGKTVFIIKIGSFKCYVSPTKKVCNEKYEIYRYKRERRKVKFFPGTLLKDIPYKMEDSRYEEIEIKKSS